MASSPEFVSGRRVWILQRLSVACPAGQRVPFFREAQCRSGRALGAARSALFTGDDSNMRTSALDLGSGVPDVDNEFTYKAGSDGSVNWSRGTFAWVAASSRGTILGGAKIPNKHTSLHSFRTESGGILGVMSHLWDPNDMTCTTRLTTDN